MGRTRLGEGSKKVSQGRLSLDLAWQPLTMLHLCVGPCWTRHLLLSPSSSLPTRCTRKERCERSREPRRFASEMKQCVRLTVHPSNISVSQYNVLVRAVWPGPGMWEEPSPPPKRATAQRPREGGAQPGQPSCSRAGPGVEDSGPGEGRGGYVQEYSRRGLMHHE